jgi:hypothetical protein
MLNVNQITSYLAKLQPDAALQRYAMMHKDDPYVVSLALAESNRRKQTRMGAQINAPQQPKVADQAIQGMASVDPMGNYVGTPMPETVGIGQLPAKNIAKMAGGGIVAFGGGGEVPRYNGMGGSFVGPVMTFQQFLASQGLTASEFANASPRDQQILRDAFKSTGIGAPSAGAAPAQAAAPSASPTGVQPGSVGKYLSGLGSIAKSVPLLTLGYELFGTSPQEQKVLRAADEKRFREKNSIPESTVGTASTADVNAMTAAGEQIAEQAAADKFRKDEQNKQELAKQTQQNQLAELRSQYQALVGPSSGATAPSAAGLPGLKPLTPEEAKASAAKLVDATPVIKQFEDYKKQINADIANREKTFLKEQAALPKFGVKAEEQLKKREQELADDKKSAGWMAVLETGLGILASTSPFALANIGAGGQRGLASYRDAMKDFKKLQSEYDKMRLDIERAQVAEKREDFKARNDFYASADARRDNVNKMGVQITSDIFQTNSKVAGEIWNAGMREAGETARTVYREQGAAARSADENRSRVALGLMGLMQEPSELRTLRGIAGDPKLEALYTRANRQETALLQEYIKNPIKLKLLEQADPAAAAIIRQKILASGAQPVRVDNALP